MKVERGYKGGVMGYGWCLIFAVGIIIQMMSEAEQDGTSLEDHLTNSIRRAKERIYSNAITNYSHQQDFSISQLSHNNSFEVRNRTSSQRNTPSSSHHKQQRNVLASAMRTLQQRIAQLERENQELKTTKKQSNQVQIVARKKQEREELELSKLASRLRERQQQIKRISRQNKDLNNNIADMVRRNRQLEDEIQKIVNKQLDFPSESNSNQDYKQKMQANLEVIHQQQLKIVGQEQQIKQLQQRNKQKQATIEELSKKLDHQKKINMRWIKMHENQLGDLDHKENNSLQSNAVPQASTKALHHPKRPETNELVRKNKEMYENLQRNKNKIADLTRECKHYEERFTEMKLIALEIVESVNKALPHQNSHIKYLTTKILKLQNNHLESLRSFSNNSRKSRIVERNSTSKSRKRSLKMEDLNSSAKKSRQGSHSKSHKKRQPIQQQITRSQKKGAKKESDQLQSLEKQIKALMKEYRNLIARGQKDKDNEQLNKKIQQIGNQYSQMKTKCQQLKKNHQTDIIRQTKQSARD